MSCGKLFSQQIKLHWATEIMHHKFLNIWQVLYLELQSQILEIPGIKQNRDNTQQFFRACNFVAWALSLRDSELSNSIEIIHHSFRTCKLASHTTVFVFKSSTYFVEIMPLSCSYNNLLKIMAFCCDSSLLLEQWQCFSWRIIHLFVETILVSSHALDLMHDTHIVNFCEQDACMIGMCTT